MLYKYCPECYSLNLSYKREIKQHKCNACGYQGPVKEDSVDKINSQRKCYLASQRSDVDAGFITKKEPENKESLVSINEKIKKKFGENSKNNDWELL